jgi:hypothetical protein
VSTGALLTPLNVGAVLGGLDVSPDGSWIYAGESLFGPTQAFLRKVNSQSGEVTNISYERDDLEAGSYEVSIGAGGFGLITTDFDGAGAVPIRTLRLSDDALSGRDDIGFLGTVGQRSHLSRSADRSTIFVQQSGDSRGLVDVYDCSTDSFVAHTTTGLSLTNRRATVAPGGSLIAMERPSDVVVFDRSLNVVVELPHQSRGLIFDPVGARLFIADVNADALVAYSTASWDFLQSWDVGEDIVQSQEPEHDGVTSVSTNGAILFLSTPQGIRTISVVANSEVRQ